MKNLLITVFFLSLTLQLSAETGGSNPVIVEKPPYTPIAYHRTCIPQMKKLKS